MTHNTRERIEELKKEFIAEYKAGHKDGGMRSYLFTGQNGSLIADWWIEKLHQELQKAREEERERCITEAWSYIVDATHAESWGREELRKRLTPPDQTTNPTN